MSAEERVCPYLGALNGPDSYWPHPASANRCYAFPTPTPITGDDQERWCLSGSYSRCPRLEAAQLSFGVRKRRAAPFRPPWKTRPLRVMVAGLVTMMVLLGCMWALVAYQTRGFSLAPLQEEEIPAEPTSAPIVPAAPASPSVIPSDTAVIPPWTDTPLPVVIPSDTPALPSSTFTAVPPMPTPFPTFTRPPTFTPRPTPMPLPTFTRPPTATRRPTSTPFPTFTLAPTRTATPSRTPTVMQYGVTLAVGSTNAQVLAGQSATFNVTVRNTAGVADTITLQLFPAVMSGWSARLVVDGADQGTGPVSVLLAANGTKVVGVQITAGAEAQPGEAGEAILSAASQHDATATASLSLIVSVKEQ